MKNATIADVIKNMSSEKRKVASYIIAKAIEDNDEALAQSEFTRLFDNFLQHAEDKGMNNENNEGQNDDGANDDTSSLDNNTLQQSEGGYNMKKNIFDQSITNKEGTILSHSDIADIIGEAKKSSSLKETVLAHGIEQIDYLFPDAKNLTNTPVFIKRKMEWVTHFMGNVGRTPFSRVRSIFADITADEARAKGYTKGNLKLEEVFTLLKRTTDPTTIYKKQKMHRDDVIDITDFNVVSWIKTEMRLMLDEEIARAALVGDGRSTASEDKISEDKIRPIYKDESLFVIRQLNTFASSATDDDKALAFIRSVIKARKNYKGSGKPYLYTTEDMLTDMLLLTDKEGRDLYDSIEKLARKMRVEGIITVEVMENTTRVEDSKTLTLDGIVCNLADYNIGADKGGAVNMFDDFDIDYNAQKYLIETRCSGALTIPYSAIVVESTVTA